MNMISRISCALGRHSWPEAWVQEQRWPNGKRSVKRCETCGLKKFKVVSNTDGAGPTTFEEFTEKDRRVSGRRRADP